MSGFGGTSESQATFTAVSNVTGPEAEREVVTGAVTDDWWRAQFAWTGTPMTASIVIAYGIANYNA